MSAKHYLYVTRAAREEMLRHGPSHREAEIIQEHLRYLRDLAREKKLLLAGSTPTRSNAYFGIFILNTDNEDKALEIMLNDPAVREGVLTVELHPFSVTTMMDDTNGDDDSTQAKP